MVTNEEEYTFRSFRQGDESGILKLWKVAFKGNLPMKRFKWKYLDTPYQETMMLCVTKSGEVVTFYGGVPYKFQYGKTTSQGVQLMDIMSHPDHRKHKVFAKTAEHFISHFCTSDNLLYMYGFPGSVHYAIGERILNYQKVTPAAYLEMNISDFLCRHLSNTQHKTITLKSVKDQDLDDTDWANLWQRFSHAYPFSLVRDAQFLKWRFFQHPEKTYKIYQFIEKIDNKIIGYAVLSIEQERAILVDFLAMHSLTIFQGILNRLCIHLSHKNVNHLVTWLPDNHFLTDWARKSGWKQRNEPTGIIPTVALFDHSPSLNWVKANMYYTMADADLF